MKTFLTLFFLFFSSTVMADDISDFQIEGMSIGDSLLDYFSEEKINNNTFNEFFDYDSENVYITFLTEDTNFLKVYDKLLVHIKNKDNNFIIYSLQGLMDLDIENCEKNKKKISKELSIIFKNTKKNMFDNQKMTGDDTGQSFYSGEYFEFLTGGIAGVYCYDWSNNVPQYSDNLRVSLYSSDFETYLMNIY